ncbi:MAG: riboflavin biosynthesis protein RibF [Kiritimatiellia bacterium]|jgi:riboflavin kinase/FMN adenylyltransferase
MNFSRQLDVLQSQRRPIALAAGFFDGVHIGHQAILRQAVAAARRLRGEAWVLTFNTHPLKVLAPESAPLLLTGLPHKLRLFTAMGMDGCIALPFNEELAACAPEKFIDDLATAAPKLAAVCVGNNWTFGRAGAGDSALLRTLSRRYGFRAMIVSPVCRQGAPVSSTRIRRALSVGHLGSAAVMLGRPFSLLGSVAPGRGQGVRQLGTPTANLNTADEALPPPGVYAVRVMLGCRRLRGIANVGRCPTLVPINADAPASPLVVETHILDFTEDIYGREMEVCFLRRLRPERRFNSPARLRGQIVRDIDRVRAWFRAGGLQTRN